MPPVPGSHSFLTRPPLLLTVPRAAVGQAGCVAARPSQGGSALCEEEAPGVRGSACLEAKDAVRQRGSSPRSQRHPAGGLRQTSAPTFRGRQRSCRSRATRLDTCRPFNGRAAMRFGPGRKPRRGGSGRTRRSRWSESTESLDHDEEGLNYGRGTGEGRPTDQGDPRDGSEASVTEGIR